MALSVEIAKAFITVGVQMEGLQKGLSQARREAEGAAQEIASSGAQAAQKTEGSWVGAGKFLAKALLAGWAAMKVGDFIKDSLQTATENLRLEGRIEFSVGNAAEAAAALNELRSLSMSTGESLKELGETYARLRREGESHLATMEQITAGYKLARVTGEELSQTVDNLNDVFGIFREQFSDFKDFSDKMAVAARNVGGGINTLMGVLKQVGPTAESVGVGFNQLVGMLTELQNRWNDSAKAGNALVEAFSKAEQLKLRLPTEEAQQQLMALLDEITRTESGIKSLKESLEKVPKGTENWKQIKDQLAQQQEYLKGLREDAKRLGEELQLPQDVELVIKKLGDAARVAFQNFREGRTDFTQFVLELDKAGANVSDLSLLFGSLSARALEVLIPALKDTQSTLSKMNDELENSGGALDKAAETIDKRADVFKRLGAIFENLRDLAGRTILSSILPALEGLANNLQQLAEGKVPNILAEMFGSEAEAAAFIGTLKEVGAVIGTALADALKIAVPLLGDFFRLVDDLFKLLKDLDVFGAFGKALENIGAVIKTLLNAMQLVVNILQGDWSGAWRNVQEIFGGVAKVVEGVLGLIEKLSMGLRQVLENLMGIKREVAAAPGATAEEQRALGAQRTMAASLEKLGPSVAKQVQDAVAQALKMQDQQKAIEMLIKAIYTLASAEGKLPVEIGSAMYDILVVQGKQEWAKALNEAFKKTGMGQGKQAGGLVRGTGVGDVVPTRLEPGEFVVRKEAVKRYGPSFLYALNEGIFRPMRGLGVLLADVGQDITAVYGARFGVGGKVPGVGVGDRVPALLEPGEFVVRKDAVQHYGLARLYALNERAIPRFQAGGLVGPVGDLSVAEIARLAEQQGMWWVAYRRLAMDEMRALWRTDPMMFKEKLLKALVWGIMHVREQVAVAEKMYADFFGGKVPTVEQLAKELGYTRSALLNLVRAPMSDVDAADLMRRVLEKYPNFPRKLGATKVQSIIGALGFIEDLSVEKFMKAGLEGRMQMIMDNVKGLGPAKSAFALASLGIDDIATIDIWMGRKVLLPALERIASLPDEEILRLGYTRAELQAKIAAWKGSGGGWKNIKDYLRDVHAAFGDIATSGTRQWEAYWNIFKENGALENASIAFRKESHLPFFKELGISKQLAAQKYGINIAKADQAALLATMMTQKGMGTLFDLSDIAEGVGMPTLAEMIKSSDFKRLYTVRVPAMVEDINNIVTRHLENATIMARMGETVVQAFGDEHLQGSVEALARELSAYGKTQMAIMPVEGTPTVMTFLKGKGSKGIAKATSEFLAETLGAGELAPASFIRLYTERKENLADLAREFFGDKFRISEALGVWRGGQELSAMIDVPFSARNASLATELARVINEVNNQSAVLMAIRSGETGHIGARLITERATKFTQELAREILHGGERAKWAYSKYRILFHKFGATVADLAEDLGIEIKFMDEGITQALKAAGLESTGLFTTGMPSVLKRAGVRISTGYEGMALIHDIGATVGTLAHEVGHGLDYMITKYAPRAIPYIDEMMGSLFKTFEGLLEQPEYLAEVLKITKETRGITGWDSVDDFVMNFVEKNKVFGRQRIINMLGEFHALDILDLIKNEAAQKGYKISEMAFASFTPERLLAYPLSPSELFADFFRAWALEYETTKALAPKAVMAFEKMVIPALKAQSPKLMAAIEKFALRTGKSLANLALFFLPTPMDVDMASLESALVWLLKNYRITPDEAEIIYEYELGQRLDQMVKAIGSFAEGRGGEPVEPLKPLLELDARGNLVVSKHGGAAAGRLVATAEEVKKYLGGWGFVKTRNLGQMALAVVNQLLAGALGSEFQNRLEVARATEQLVDWIRWHREASPEALDMMYGWGSRVAPKMYQKGGMVPGVGHGDRVPALLEPGEFVVPRDVVREYGRGYFEQMRMQKGGFVPPVPVLEEELIPWEEMLKAMKEAEAAAPAAPMPVGGLSVAALAAQPAAPPAPAMGGLTVGAAAAGAMAETPLTATVGMAARGELPRPALTLPGMAGAAEKGAAPELALPGMTISKVSAELGVLGQAATEAADALKATAKANLVTEESTKAIEENTRATDVHRQGIERAEKATRDFATTTQKAAAQTSTFLSEFWDALKSNAQGFATRVFGPVGEVISALIGGGPVIGAVVNAFFGLMMQSKEFGKLMEEVNPLIEALADVVGLLLSPLTEFFKWLRQLLGIKKKTPQRQPGAMNIPTGFKLERARYAATAPGEPGGGGAPNLGKVIKGIGVAALIYGAFKFLAGKIKGLGGSVVKLLGDAWSWGASKLGDFGRWALDAMKGVARGGFRALRGIGSWIASAIKIVGDIVVEAGKLIWDFVGATIKVIGEIVKSIADFVVSFANAVIEIAGTIVKAISDFVVQFASAVIEIVGTIVRSVTDFVVNFVNAAIQIAGTIVKAVTDFAVSFVNNIIQITGAILKGIGEFVVTFVDKAIQIVGAIVKSVADFIIGVAGAAIQLVGNAIVAITDFLVSVAGATIGVVGQVVVEAAKVLWNAATATIQLVGTVALDALAVAWDLATDVLAGAGELLKNGAVTAWNTAMSVVGSVGSTLLNIAQTAWQTAMNVIGGAGNALVNIAKGAWQAAMNVVGTIGNTLSDIAKGAWQTAMNVIGGMGSALGTIAQTAWQTAMNVVGGIGSTLGTIAQTAWQTAMNVVGGIGSTLSTIAQTAWQTAANVVGGIGSTLGNIAQTAWQTAMNVVGGAGQTVKDIAVGAWNLLTNTLKGTGTWLFDMAKGAWNVVTNTLSGAANAFVSLASGAWNNVVSPALNALGGAIGGVFGGVLGPAFNAVATPLSNAFGGFLGPAFSAVAGPLGAAFPTLLQWAFEALGIDIGGVFKSLLKPAFEAIANGLKWVWDNLIKPVWEPMWNALKATWENVIKPVWDALWGAVKAAWDNVIKPLWKIMWDTIAAAWNNVIKPVWDLLWGAIKGAWDNVIKPVWNTLWGAIKSAYDNVIAPVWNAFWGAVKSAWDNVVKPVWSAIWGTIKSAWDNVISPVWGAMWNTIKWVWDNVIKPAWDGIGAALNMIWNAFKSLYNMMVAPINTILSLWNGLIGAVAGINIFGVKPFEWMNALKVPLLPTLQTGGEITAGGAAILHPAEVVLNPDIVSRLDKALSGEYAMGAPAAIVVQGNLVIDDQDVVRAVQDYIERHRLVTKGVRTGVI